MKPMVEPWCPSWVGCVDVVPGGGEREIELGGSRMVRLHSLIPPFLLSTPIMYIETMGRGTNGASSCTRVTEVLHESQRRDAQGRRLG